MDCLTLIATRRLSDGDMRAITATLEIATELERIGAYAGDIARIPFMVIEQPLLALLVDVHSMAIKAREMLQRAIQAFVSRDLGLACAVLSEGHEVDDLYNRLYRSLLGLVKGKSRKNGSRAAVNQARYLTRVARNLKRAADHVAAICQWGVFCVTGDVSRMGEESAVISPEYPAHAQEATEKVKEESLLSC
jgi:phosphate transport system protein